MGSIQRRRKRHPIVICLVGENGSGKGTVARFFGRRGAKVWKFSTVLSDILRRLHVPDTKDNEIDLAQALRRAFGEDILARVIASELKSSRPRIAVLDGLRFPAELQTLRRLPGFCLVYVTAPLRLRFERTRQRREKGSDFGINRKEFLRLQRRPTERFVTGLGRRASLRIVNDGTLDELKRKVRELYRRLHP